jgi:uncharacterized small protein (DUF1192 family)
MDPLNLPKSTRVQRIIPKNAFDEFTSARQKKQFSENISRITWLYKLSPDTTNLESKEIKEIQIFRVELRQREPVQALLDIIDKSIPYTIVYLLEFDGQVMVSTSSKHPHPADDNKSVIDWTFTTDWKTYESFPLKLKLSKSIDEVYREVCAQISGETLTNLSLPAIIERRNRVKTLTSEIAKLKALIKKSDQFNRTVEFNLELKGKERELSHLLSNVKNEG